PRAQGQQCGAPGAVTRPRARVPCATVTVPDTTSQDLKGLERDRWSRPPVDTTHRPGYKPAPPRARRTRASFAALRRGQCTGARLTGGPGDLRASGAPG